MQEDYGTHQRLWNAAVQSFYRSGNTSELYSACVLCGLPGWASQEIRLFLNNHADGQIWYTGVGEQKPLSSANGKLDWVQKGMFVPDMWWMATDGSYLWVASSGQPQIRVGCVLSFQLEIDPMFRHLQLYQLPGRVHTLEHRVAFHQAGLPDMWSLRLSVEGAGTLRAEVIENGNALKVRFEETFSQVIPLPVAWSRYARLDAEPGTELFWQRLVESQNRGFC